MAMMCVAWTWRVPQPPSCTLTRTLWGLVLVDVDPKASTFSHCRKRGCEGSMLSQEGQGSLDFCIPEKLVFFLDCRTPSSMCIQLAPVWPIASPLQVIWLFGHLRRNHALATSGQIQPKVEDLVRAYCLELLCQLTSTTSTRQSPASSMTMEAFGAPSQLLCPQDPFQSISCWWQSGSP